MVSLLAKEFDANKAHYLSPTYQESEVRKDFIDKFLIALGWDVNHDWQKSPFEQEVKVERGVSMQGSQRRADYAFCVAPNFRDVRLHADGSYRDQAGLIKLVQNGHAPMPDGISFEYPGVAIVRLFSQYLTDCHNKHKRTASKP